MTSRQPSGIPVGGQFAASQRAEADISLPADVATETKNLRNWVEEELDRVYDSERELANAQETLAARQILEMLPHARTADVQVDRPDGYPVWHAFSAQDADGNELPEDEMDQINDLLSERSGHWVVHTDKVLSNLIESADRMPDGYPEQVDLTPEQSSQARVEEALQGWADTSDEPRNQLRDVLTDLRHHAERHGIDIYEVLDGSYEVYLEEKADPTFTRGFGNGDETPARSWTDRLLDTQGT